LYQFRSYPGVGHTVTPDELTHIKAFIQSTIPDDPAYLLKPKDPSEMSVKELREAIKKRGLGHKAVGLTEKSEFVQLLKDNMH
jgi:hypothetical protein